MKHWQSKLGPKWIDLDAKHRFFEGVEAGEENLSSPKCHRCSVTYCKRVAVVEHGVAHSGKAPDHRGVIRPYVDVKAQCHGREEVLRIYGIDWQRAGQWDELEQHAAVSAIMGLIFFRMAP